MDGWSRTQPKVGLWVGSPLRLNEIVFHLDTETAQSDIALRHLCRARLERNPNLERSAHPQVGGSVSIPSRRLPASCRSRRLYSQLQSLPVASVPGQIAAN